LLLGQKMKRIIIIISIFFIFIWNSFAIYTISFQDYKKITELTNLIFQKVDSKYKNRINREKIYWTLVNSIDGYIILKKEHLSQRVKIILLYLKTLIIKHMWYKIWNPIQVEIK